MNASTLCIDLDGTLVKTDTLHELAIRLFRDHFLAIFFIPFWLAFGGKARLKKEIANRVRLDPSTLPFTTELVEWLGLERSKGRRIVLCTAADVSIARAIADHVGIFDEVMASDGTINLAGRHKADALVVRFGHKGFDYAGNAPVDLHVWEHAKQAIVVNASSALLEEVKEKYTVAKVFFSPPAGLTAWRKALRVHQWMKNLLLFIPLVAAHRVTDYNAWLQLLIAFFSFSLCASSVYIANDLLDLESDRAHLRKRLRPFANAALPIWKGVVAAPLLLALSAGLAVNVSGGFAMWLGIYFFITCLYSFKLKQVVLVDGLILAVLYTLRIVAGAAALSMALSFWLLAFSGFLFLSLALVKRFAELQVQLLQGKHKAHGRGYFTDDAPLIQMMGMGSAFTAVLVLALYLNSPDVLRLYKAPNFIWGCVPVMLYWLSWVWLNAHRGLMHDDPLVFAVKDKASLISGAVFGVFLMLGATGWLA